MKKLCHRYYYDLLQRNSGAIVFAEQEQVRTCKYWLVANIQNLKN